MQDFVANKVLDYFPGARAAFAMGDKANVVLKSLFLLIVLILSIVLLAGASKSSSKYQTGKGKITLSLSVLVFVMTLLLPFLRRLQINTNPKVASYYIVYFILALTATILAYRDSKALKNTNKDTKNINNAKRAATGITVIVGIYLILTLWMFFGFDKGVNYWSRKSWFLKPQI